MSRVTGVKRLYIVLLFLVLSQLVTIHSIDAVSNNEQVIIDEYSISDNRCDIGSVQTIGFHARWSNINSSVVNGKLFVEDSSGGFEKLSSGKIFYDTFSKNGGTEPDEDWHQGFTWYGGRVFDEGYWEVEDGKFKAIYDGGSAFTYPMVWVENFVWEAKVMSLNLIREGPSIRCPTYINGSMVYDSVFDYYHAGESLRLMINSDREPHTTFETASYTMQENKWYTMKYSVQNGHVMCYLDGKIIFDVTDDLLTSGGYRRLLHCGYTEGETGYIDDVKIWESNYIYLDNTISGQKIELCDENGVLVSEETATGDSLVLDVSSISFPFKGYFKVYDASGQLEYSTQMFNDIWGGDKYWVDHTMELTTDENGWVYFEDRLPLVGMKKWSVVEVECNGVTDFIQNTSSPSIIWDRVSLQLDADDLRIDAGSSASIDAQGVYEYDNSVFDGVVRFNNELFQRDVGKVEYTVVEITDPLYGLTEFSVNNLDIVFDMVSIDLEVQDDCIDVGESMSYSWEGVYMYDNTPFQGRIEFNYPTRMEDVGRLDFVVSSIDDALYGLTVFESDSFSCCWDRVEVYDGGVSNEVSRVGDMETVWFKARYEYGGEEFTERDGVLFVNGMPLVWSSYDNQWKYSTSLDESGSRVFEVTDVEDYNYGLTMLNDEVGPLTVVWEKPFWETPVGVISIGGLVVVIVSMAVFFFRKRI